MEKFARLISIEGNYGYNVYGETFFITKDLFPITTPCVIAYNPEWTSSINRIEIDTEGEELYYTINVRHAERVFSSTEELAQYRKAKWEERELVIAEHKRILSKLDFSELISL